MFPVLMIQCAQPGLLYVNGAFCGELAGPRMVPVLPDGRVYVEYRALAGPAFPLAVALELREGALVPPLPASVYAVQWPDRVIELELRPALLPVASGPRETPHDQRLEAGLVHQRLGDEEALCFGDLPLFALPDGTRDLRMRPLPAMPGFSLLLGEHPGGASAWLLELADGGPPALAGQVQAQQIALEEDGSLGALSYANDAVGHAHLTVYRPQNRRLERLSRQHAWMPGAPRWPQTERDTLRAWLEAMLAGAEEEAAAYLAPEAAAGLAARPLPAFQAAVELPRPPLAWPSGHPLALGLLETRAANLGAVRPVYARAVARHGAQGPWLLESITLE